MENKIKGDYIMKEIFEVKQMHYESGKSKSIVAYADMDTAIFKVKKLNAQYGNGEPFFMHKKIIDD